MYAGQEVPIDDDGFAPNAYDDDSEMDYEFNGHLGGLRKYHLGAHKSATTPLQILYQAIK